MAYHPGVGVSSLATSAPTFLNSPIKRTQFDKNLLTVLKITSILFIEQTFAFEEGDMVCQHTK